MSIILGSQSPRRKEILNYFSLPFEQIPSAYDEDLTQFRGDPTLYALELSQKKADALRHRYKDRIILTADTVVFLDGKIFNKPKDKEEAKHFLNQLSGKWHEVYTAVTVQRNDQVFSEHEKTKILFQSLTEEHIELYLTHFAWSDKAGGYAIQQGGSIIVKQIDGCYYNVMGLPIHTVNALLTRMGIDLWKHLKMF